MNIAIIDNYHFEVTASLITLFDKDENNITVFIHAEAYRQLQHMLAGKKSRYKFILKSETETNRQFIRRLFEYINGHSYDLLYFNSIEDNFIHYAFYIRRLKPTKTILTIHNINGFFEYRPSLSVRRLIRYIGKYQLRKVIGSYNILSETLMPCLKNKLSAPKKIFNIPGGCFSPQNYKPLIYQKYNTLQIAIPGSVDSRRRNYDLVFDFLKIAQFENLSVEVFLLGGFAKGHSEKIRQRCDTYLETNDNLKIYGSSIVEQQEFDMVLSQSHFIWMPLQSTTKTADGVKEHYGVSTCSGNIGDAVRHAKPFFFPAEIPLDHALEKCSLRYSTIHQMIGIIKDLDEERYYSMQRDAYHASLYYTKENIVKRNPELFS